MTLMEMMIGNFQADQGTSITQMSAQSARRSNKTDNYSCFGDILNTSMSSADKISADKIITKKTGFNEAASRKDHESADLKTDSTAKYQSFRKVNKYGRKRHNTPAAERSGAEQRIDDNIMTEEKVVSDKEALGQNVPSDMMQLVAKLLGLDILELQKLLNEVGITPDSLNSLQNISTLSAELAQVLGLNSDQQKTLEIMLQTAGEVLELPASQSGEENAFADHFEKANAQSFQAPVQSVQENLQAVTAQSEFLTEQLSEQIRMKLDEYGIRLEEGEASVEEDLKALILPLLEKTAVKVQPAALQGTDQTAVEAFEPELTAAGAEDAQRESSLDSEEGNDRSGSNVKAQQSVSQQHSGANSIQTQPVFSSVIQANQVVDEIPVTDLLPTPVNARELLSQIIEKAQVNLTPEKSEMVMELKPESLGKISLKVVTENGIVMAKFVAENQQVREVLETNMQILKDSLQKQGLDVQGFSVSVRQDSDRSGENRQQYGKASNYTKKTISGIKGPEAQLPLFPDAAGRSSQYIWEASTIDVTA